MLLYDYVNDHRPRLSIPISAIISVRVLTSLEVPLEFSSFQCTGESTSNLQFFEIETFPRVYYLMIKNETELFMWLRSFSHLLTGEVKDISATSTIIPINAPLLSHSININDMYLARPKDWRMKKRSVFNFRRIHFRPPATSRSPLQIVEIALQLVFELVEYDRSVNQADGGRDGGDKNVKNVDIWAKETALSKWIAFLDQVHVSLFQTYTYISAHVLFSSLAIVIFVSVYFVYMCNVLLDIFATNSRHDSIIRKRACRNLLEYISHYDSTW